MAEKLSTFLEKLPHRLFGVVSILILVLIGISVLNFFGLLGRGASDTALLANILHSLILVELLHLSLVYAVKEIIDPQELILIILTAVGRKIITTEDIYAQNPFNVLVLGVILFVCIYGLRVTYKMPMP